MKPYQHTALRTRPTRPPRIVGRVASRRGSLLAHLASRPCLRQHLALVTCQGSADSDCWTRVLAPVHLHGPLTGEPVDVLQASFPTAGLPPSRPSSSCPSAANLADADHRAQGVDTGITRSSYVLLLPDRWLDSPSRRVAAEPEGADGTGTAAVGRRDPDRAAQRTRIRPRRRSRHLRPLTAHD